MSPRAKSTPQEPPEGHKGPYHVFHHVYAGGAPTMYTARVIEIRGAFAHFTDDKGNEMWLSGQLTIRPVPAKGRR